MSQGIREKCILFLALMVQKLWAEIWVHIWPFGGARELKLENPTLLCLMLKLFSIFVPNFISFPQVVLYVL